MYTRCPHCRTVFSVTEAQIRARGGVVKCGHCAEVFRADHYLTRELPKKSPAQTTSTTKSAPVKATAAKKKAAPKKEKVSTATKPAPKPEPKGPVILPTLQELLHGRDHVPTRPLPWIIASALAGLVLVLQFLHFYASEISQVQPFLRPLLTHYCALTHCAMRPPLEPGLIELTKTTIAPHPKYANALSLRATMINRAAFTQAYPVMEVSITNRDGIVIGRRTFRPEDYLAKAPAVNDVMVPNVIVHTRIAFTLPHQRADGYEIRLIADPNLLVKP